MEKCARNVRDKCKVEIDKEKFLDKFSLLKRPADFEFQQLGLELQKVYGKSIWAIFSMSFATEDKIRKAHDIAVKRGKTNLAYLIGTIKKL